MMRMAIVRSFAAGIACFLGVAGSAGAVDSDGSTGRGKAVFEGQKEVAGIKATIGGRPANAAFLRCSSCHGRDGLGRSESDAIAPPIIRGDGGLDRPGMAPSGAIRQAYDLASFIRAIRDGIAVDGRSLSGRMPRYAIAADDAAALWEWLAVLPGLQRSGVGHGELVFGVWAPTGRDDQRTLLVSLLQLLTTQLEPRYGYTIAWREVEIPLADGACPRTDALMLVLAEMDIERRILEKARECSLPVLVPFDMLTGSEDPYEVRGLRASLAAHWKALLAEAGRDAAVLLPAELADWQGRAARLSQLKAASPNVGSGATNVLVPFGLDSVQLPSEPARVYAPLTGSTRTASQWLGRGHELHLSSDAFAQPDAKNTDRLATVLAQIVETIDKASILAGRAPTRAGFIEAFDGVTATDGATSYIDYRRNQLTGSAGVAVSRYR